MKNIKNLKLNIQFFSEAEDKPTPQPEPKPEEPKGVDLSELVKSMTELKNINNDILNKNKELEESNKKLQKDLADKIMSSNIDNKNKISTKELYEKVLKGGYKNDRDHVVDILELRKRVMNETSNHRDIFAPTRNISRVDRERAEDVANYLQNLVNTYQDPVTFKAQFCYNTEFVERPSLASKKK